MPFHFKSEDLPRSLYISADGDKDADMVVHYMRVKPCHMCEGTGESEEYISGICGYCNSTGWVIA